MKLILKISLACLLATGCASKISAQTYVKLNGLYALVGVVNPAVEFTISPKSTFQTEIVVSPWKSINNHHALFLYLHGRIPPLFQGAQPRLVPPEPISACRLSTSRNPTSKTGSLKFENRYSKGYGFMIGLCVGYEHIFRERWVLDAYFGWSWMSRLLQRLFHGRENRHEPRPSGRTQIPPIRSTVRRSGIPTRSDCRSDTVFSIRTRKK